MKQFYKFSEWFSNIALAIKLGLAFFIVLVLTLIIGCFSLFQLGQVNAISNDLALKWMPNIGNTTTFRTHALEVRSLEIKHVSAADAGYMDEYEEKIKAEIQLANVNNQEYKNRATDAQSIKLFTIADKAWRDYLESNKKVLSLGRAGKHDDAKEISDGASKSHLDDCITAIDALTVFNFKSGRLTANTANTTYVSARVLTIGLLAIVVLLGTLMGIVITRSLLKDLGGEPSYASQLTSEIAEGKLYLDIHLQEGDKRSLLASIRNMRNGIAKIVKAVRLEAESIAVSSDKIDQSNLDLSKRTSQQVNALQQTADSMVELKASVNKNADGAHQASQLSSAASQIALGGGEAVLRVVETMREINESSKKIFDIIGIIDSIAFQTNILALNAAVEAARAGEQGRGFAVVASEVRSLASRSSMAAKDIKNLVAASVERVEKGTQQVDKAGLTMSEVVESIRKVTALIGQISTASEVQREQVAMVSTAISQIDDVTQQNSALVEEMTAATSNLSAQAQELVQAVATFILNKNDIPAESAQAYPRLSASSSA